MALKSAKTKWRDVVLVCRKCSRKLDGGFGPDGDKTLKKALRKYLKAGKGKEALTLVDDDRDPAMLAIRGDAEMALGERAKAREAYAKALGLVDAADPQHRLLQLKLIEAGGTPPHTEDRT